MTSAGPLDRLRIPATFDGYIDGAWWPRSRDLDTELAPLLDELTVHEHPVGRVIYNQGYWSAGTRRIRAAGQVVRLGAFSTQEVNVVSFIDNSGSRRRLDLLVIDPETAPAAAERALTLASHPGEPLRAAAILSRSRPIPASLGSTR